MKFRRSRMKLRISFCEIQTVKFRRSRMKFLNEIQKFRRSRMKFRITKIALRGL